MKFYLNTLILGIILLLTAPLASQNIGIGTNNPHESAALEIRSINKGLLLPVMGSADRTAISNPAYGLIVFDAIEESLYWRDSTAWVKVTDAQSGFTDNDGDTKILLDKNLDDDIIRFYSSGNEVMNLNMNRLEFLNSGESVFIGESAGENDDLLLNRNTFVGHHAGQLNQTGTQNVALGNQALTKSVAGNNNVAIGKQSLFENLGSNNTAIGFDAGNNNTTGTKNTIIGGKAGFENKTGDQNTLLGYEAGGGISSQDINGSVMLGHQAGKNETENNRLIIANNNTTEPLIYGKFDQKTATIHGMLGINSKNPDGELVINDNTNFENNSVAAKLRTQDAEMIIGYNPTNEGILGTVTNHDLRIRTNNINRLTIKKDGNVGIGTAFPDKKLDLRGSAKILDSLSIGVTDAKARLHIRENGVANERTVSGILESSISKRPTLLFSESTSSNIDNGMSIEYNGTGTGTNNKLIFNKTGGDAAMTISNAGNIGIGTIAPLAQLDIRRTDGETLREQVHLWQAGTGDANLRFSRGFFTSQSFNVGIDGSDDKFKISSSENNLIAGLNQNTILEVDHSKTLSLKGDLKLDQFAGNGSRNLKIQADGKVVLDEEIGYYSKALNHSNFFTPSLPLEDLYLPQGAILEEVSFVFLDNNTSSDIQLQVVRGRLVNGNFVYEVVCEIDSGNYANSPNVRKVTLFSNNIHLPIVDNDNYSYAIIGEDGTIGTPINRKAYAVKFKYSAP